MAINLKNAEAEALLKKLAQQTGESLTQAASAAFRERLARLEAVDEARANRRLAPLLALIEEARRAPRPDDPGDKATTDELWGEP